MNFEPVNFRRQSIASQKICSFGQNTNTHILKMFSFLSLDVDHVGVVVPNIQDSRCIGDTARQSYAESESDFKFYFCWT